MKSLSNFLRRRCISVVGAFAVSGALITLLAAHPWAAEKNSRTSTTRSSRPPRGSEGQLAEKLDKIISNQEEILKQLDNVMKELAIVKIRATMRRGG